MTTKPSKPQLHVSMLNSMSMCGVAFQRRYGAKFGIWPTEEKTPPSLALIIGISVHQIVEKNLQQKIDNGKLLSLEEVRDTARDAFTHSIENELALSDEEAENPKLAIETARDMTIALAELHAIEVAPNINPVAVEERWVIELNDYNIDLAGQIDIIEVGDIIDDTKTAGKRLPTAETIQMAMYASAYKIMKGRYPKKCRLHGLIKNKTPKFQLIEAVPEARWIDPLFRRIEHFVRIVEAERDGHRVLTPCDPTHWKCTKKFCGYTEDCPYFSGRN